MLDVKDAKENSSIMKFLTFHLNDALTYTSIAIQLVANQASLCSIHLFLLLLTLHSKKRGKKRSGRSSSLFETILLFRDPHYTANEE